MTKVSPWDAIHRERGALASDLAEPSRRPVADPIPLW